MWQETEAGSQLSLNQLWLTSLDVTHHGLAAGSFWVYGYHCRPVCGCINDNAHPFLGLAMHPISKCINAHIWMHTSFWVYRCTHINAHLFLGVSMHTCFWVYQSMHTSCIAATLQTLHGIGTTTRHWLINWMTGGIETIKLSMSILLLSSYCQKQYKLPTGFWAHSLKHRQLI